MRVESAVNKGTLSAGDYLEVEPVPKTDLWVVINPFEHLGVVLQQNEVEWYEPSREATNRPVCEGDIPQEEWTVPNYDMQVWR